MATECVFLSHPQSRDSGDYAHRVTLPGQAMAGHLDVVDIQTTHPDFLARCLAAGVLVVLMVADEVVLELMRERRRRGLATVYEISDDFRDFPTSLPGHAVYAQQATQATIEAAAAAADLLQFSSHGLQRKYGALNPCHVVLPNQLSVIPEWRETSPQRQQRPVLGWAGSVGHQDEARELAIWLKSWLDSRKDLHRQTPVLRVMAAGSLVQLFKQTGLQVQAVPPGSFEQYLAFLASVDIGFAVLGHTDFSAGRSDGKFLEYAAHGVLCIASQHGEYLIGIRQGETGLLFADGAGFMQCLDKAFDDAGLRGRISLAAYEHVRRERTHARAAVTRLNYYREFIPPEQRVADAEGPVQSDGGVLRVLTDPIETMLLQATLLHGRGALDQALKYYLQAIEARPDFYLPWYRGGLVAKALGSPQDAALFLTTAEQRLALQLSAA
jgi:hypothetical protein